MWYADNVVQRGRDGGGDGEGLVDGGKLEDV